MNFFVFSSTFMHLKYFIQRVVVLEGGEEGGGEGGEGEGLG